MIANLFQSHQRFHDQASTLKVGGRFSDAFQHILGDRFVERGLLTGQVAIHHMLGLIWQIRQNRLVCFQPPQNKWLHQLAQLRGSLIVAMLDATRIVVLK